MPCSISLVVLCVFSYLILLDYVLQTDEGKQMVCSKSYSDTYS
jgi:hypothetical protein